mmetsp:Transcript_24054/g.52606  ORF Transcript_24054/g.52606 Transcript_24054/m.52606 type:complete len:222 (-) Transcript_24054:906-1571(-)
MRMERHTWAADSSPCMAEGLRGGRKGSRWEGEEVRGPDPRPWDISWSMAHCMVRTDSSLSSLLHACLHVLATSSMRSSMRATRVLSICSTSPSSLIMPPSGTMSSIMDPPREIRRLMGVTQEAVRGAAYFLYTHRPRLSMKPRPMPAAIRIHRPPSCCIVICASARSSDWAPHMLSTATYWFHNSSSTPSRARADSTLSKVSMYSNVVSFGNAYAKLTERT